MTDKLPPNLLALFAPRPPLRYMPPSDRAPEERRTAAISGVAAFIPALKEKEAQADKSTYTESWLEKKERVKLEKTKKREYILNEAVKLCEFDISTSHHVKSQKLTSGFRQAERRPEHSRRPLQDPLRLPTELRYRSERLGEGVWQIRSDRAGMCLDDPTIEVKANTSQIRLVQDTHAAEKKGAKAKKKNRGYAFIVYEKERDMKGIFSPLYCCVLFYCP